MLNLRKIMTNSWFVGIICTVIGIAIIAPCWDKICAFCKNLTSHRITFIDYRNVNKYPKNKLYNAVHTIKVRGNKIVPKGTKAKIEVGITPNTVHVEIQLPGQKTMRDFGDLEINSGIIEIPINLVYILCSDENEVFVQTITERLLQDGFLTWYDKRDLLPGDNLELKWKSVVESADYIVLFLSKESCNSKGKYFEELKYILQISKAKDKSKPYIIPVLVNDCIPPVEIANLYPLDMRENNTYDKLLKVLSN